MTSLHKMVTYRAPAELNRYRTHKLHIQAPKNYPGTDPNPTGAPPSPT